MAMISDSVTRCDSCAVGAGNSYNDNAAVSAVGCAGDAGRMDYVPPQYTSANGALNARSNDVEVARRTIDRLIANADSEGSCITRDEAMNLDELFSLAFPD